ncbi:MAG TPA: CPBP family intramembrane glutamic endopeptidase [Caulobacteraceae bacterium]|jgi:hypothetical protein|nr:CPBP family intramembrane glutamic endopeptidase [Caulobacteraceae bacterium]
MNSGGLWSGLMGSALLGGLDERDRSFGRLILAIAGGLLLGVVAALAAWCLVMIPFTLWMGLGGDGIEGLRRAAEALNDPHQSGLTMSVARLAVSVAGEVAFLVVFVAVAAMVGGRSFHVYVTAASKVRWRLLAVGMALAAVAIAPMVAGERILAAGEAPPILAIAPDWPSRALYVAAALLLVPAALSEELFFRGWMLRQIAAFADRTAPVVLLASILFAAAHFDFDPQAFLQRALMGGGLAYMALRLGGIEFPAGVHAMHNILIVLFIEPLTPSSAGEPLSAFALLYDVALVASYFVITEAMVHSRSLRRLGGLERTEISPPDDSPQPR